MSDFVPTERARSRFPFGIVAGVVLLAFVVGAVLMGYAMKHAPWLGARTAEPEAVTARAPEGFSPAQPLTPGAPAVDTNVLETREAALAGQLSALEARTAGLSADAAAAGNQAVRAESLLVAFAARRAIDRGAPLGYLEEQLRQRFGGTQPRAVAIVVQAGRQPATLSDLSQQLDALGPELATGAHADGWLSSLGRELGSLVVLRDAGTPSRAPAERLASARRLLADGDVDGARRIVADLPGAEDAATWIADARRYILAHQALDTIESAAFVGRNEAPTLSPPPPAPVQTQTTAGH